MTHSKSKLSGILLMLQASFAFSIMALCVKWASQNIPSLELVFFRSLIGTIMLLSLMIIKKISPLGHNHGLMIIRGFSGFAALSLYFYTIAHLPLGAAVLLNYTSPIFAALLAMVFLHERPSLFLWAMILVSFLGVYLLVYDKWNAHFGMIFVGLLSAIFASIAYVTIRAIRHRESPLTVIFYFTAISTVGSIFFLPLGFVWPDWKNWIAILGIGIGSYYGQLYMTMSLRRAPTSLVGPFSYLTPVLSTLYGLLFFHEKMQGPAIAGALLIMLSGSLITYQETKKKKTVAASLQGGG